MRDEVVQLGNWERGKQRVEVGGRIIKGEDKDKEEKGVKS